MTQPHRDVHDWRLSFVVAQDLLLRYRCMVLRVPLGIANTTKISWVFATLLLLDSPIKRSHDSRSRKRGPTSLGDPILAVCPPSLERRCAIWGITSTGTRQLESLGAYVLLPDLGPQFSSPPPSICRRFAQTCSISWPVAVRVPTKSDDTNILCTPGNQFAVRHPQKPGLSCFPCARFAAASRCFALPLPLLQQKAQFPVSPENYQRPNSFPFSTIVVQVPVAAARCKLRLSPPERGGNTCANPSR